VRVATLNLWGRSGDWPARRTALTAGLRELRPDVMAFQETDDDQVADLLGPEYEVVQRGFIAIASRWPFGDVRELEAERTPRSQDFPASSLAAEVLAPEPLLFVNHFPPWAPDHEAERERHTVAATRLVDEIVGARDLHVVLAGDLDATPDASSIRFLRGRQALEGTSVSYWDAWETANPGDAGHTFTPRNPLVMEESDVTREEPRRIDYVFVRAGARGPTLDVADCRLIFDEPVGGVWASDHFGVAAELTPFSRSDQPLPAST
jgi:endonuclease/exonuclease/phosphatase family metal-dependent hydrolase